MIDLIEGLFDLPILDLFTDLDLINILKNDCVPVVKNQEIKCSIIFINLHISLERRVSSPMPLVFLLEHNCRRKDSQKACPIPG